MERAASMSRNAGHGHTLMTKALILMSRPFTSDLIDYYTT